MNRKNAAVLKLYRGGVEKNPQVNELEKNQKNL